MFTQYSQTWWEGCFCYNSVTTDGFITDIEDLENKFLTLPRNERVGTFYGQCSEICGVWHGFMPIVVEAVSANDFLV